MTPEEVREQVRAGGLLPIGDRQLVRPVVAMLSGGRDSVCLLDLAVGICGSRNVHALHVNYGLRAEADGDERHCRALCERLGVALEVVHTRAEGDPDPPGNLQAWARELRYRAAEELARPKDALIATGHTATDQVETILYRLAASPGRRALLGMAARDGRLVRPLLELTREQTAAYCRARGLEWREDSSNDDEHYARVRVRSRLVPAFDAVHPAARENVLRTARLLREEAEVLDGLVEAELEGAAAELKGAAAELKGAAAEMKGAAAEMKGAAAEMKGAAAEPKGAAAEMKGAAAEPKGAAAEMKGAAAEPKGAATGMKGAAAEPKGAATEPDGAASIAIERLEALPAALARLVVVRLAEQTAGTYVPQAGARVGEILDLARRGGRAELHVGGLVGAVVENGRLHMVKLPPRG
jgi:tRNA(Ile)-lysidine synthase